MKRVAIGSLIMVLALAGCRVLEDDELGTELIGVKWELEAFQRADGTEEPFGSQGMRLEFLPQGELAGSLYMLADPGGTVLPYSSRYVVEADGSLTIEEPELDVPDNQIPQLPRSSRWADYRMALSRATSYEVQRNRLFITHSGDAHILSFRLHSR